jgi:hypothetical protein
MVVKPVSGQIPPRLDTDALAVPAKKKAAK